jgi:Leucine-rich repeat (LRR) protein
MLKQNDYSGFSFEDFLQDNFFVDSMKHPTDESLLFWKEFQEKNEGRLHHFNAARRFIEDTCKQQLSHDEVAGIWTNIQTSNKPVIRLRLIRYAGIAVTAGIVAVTFLFLIKKPNEKSEDIIAFVNEHRTQAAPGSETRLILSDNKIVSLPEKESAITYDSTMISTSSEEISKKEVATFNQLIIPHGKRSILILDDGTKIWVNAGSKLVYPAEFEKEKREIYVDGEIFLDVAHDTLRPFIVHTNDISIQVVGTRFNVQAYASDARKQVALEQGIIKVLSGNNEILISPDKMYEYENGQGSVKDVNIKKYTSWVDGLYLYESEQLEVILKRLSRYYGKEIIADQTSAKLKCSGKLDLKNNLNDVLACITYTAPITYVYKDEKYLITYKP